MVQRKGYMEIKMKAITEQMIDQMYDELVLKVDGGMIFGVPIAMENSKHVAIASYWIGEKEGRDESQRRFDSYKESYQHMEKPGLIARLLKVFE